MPFEPKTCFPSLLADSAARVAQDLAEHYPQRPSSSVIGEMGWNAVLIPESHGGAGGGYADLASIIEALAMHAVDLPVATRCGVAPAILNALPDQACVRALLTACASGDAVLELGGPLSAGEAAQPLSARPDGQGWRLTGRTTEIHLSEDCTHVLLVCRNADNDEPLLACVESGPLREQAAGFQTMDERHVHACDVDRLPLPGEHVLASGPAARAALQAGWRVAVVAVATDTVCGMGSALARTITYLLDRRQFGQPLAQFQALRHDVARLYVIYEIARNLLQSSLRALDAPAQGAQDAAAFDLLGLYTGQEAIRFAETVIQLHGGMGMTREMPASRLATRLLANAMRFGDPLSHHQSLNRMRAGAPS
jgi:alkylation response protein AidB-like acyl-CoA dehydrogenase